MYEPIGSSIPIILEAVSFITIELESEEQEFELPGWAGEEVSGDERYYNGYLSKAPYSRW